MIERQYHHRDVISGWVDLHMTVFVKIADEGLGFIFLLIFFILFFFCFTFVFIYLEQLGLGLIGHTVTSVTT